MANNTDLVKEIDCCIDLISDTRNKISREIILSTLQRARDALRWKPIDYGKMNHLKPFLFRAHDGSIRQESIINKEYFEDFIEPHYTHYMEIPPYTSEEK